MSFLRRFTSSLHNLLRRRAALVAAAAAIALVVLMAPAPAHAGKIAEAVGNAISDVGAFVIGKAVFVVMWIISLVFGALIALEAWFLNIVLNLSLGIVNSTIVKVGFPIVLGIANLFFVAGIIVIAIATILRQERYGVKKLLWRLVLMTILVNFGLVIAGAILALTDNMTLYLVNSVNPVATGGTGDPNKGLTDFATSLAGAFNPQKSVFTVDTTVKNPQDSVQALSAWSTTGAGIGNILAPMVSVIGALGTSVMVFITLAILILMLLYRYIRLGLLLITLPLAWAAWVFPAYQKFFKKWWERFTQYAFFAPAVVFFLWLALKISEQMAAHQGEFSAFQSDASNPIIKAISSLFGSFLTPVIENLLHVLILFGIMLGGMLSAQELGVKFGTEGVKALESAGKGARNWAVRKGRAAGSRLRQQSQANKGVASSRLGRLALGLDVRLKKLSGKTVDVSTTKSQVTDADGKTRTVTTTRYQVTGKTQLRQDIDRAAEAAKDKVQMMARYLDPEYMGRKAGESVEEWQNRLQQMDPQKFKFKIETDKEGIARLEKLISSNPTLSVELANQGLGQQPGESDEAWYKRILDNSTDARFARKQEDDAAWAKRVAAEEEKRRNGKDGGSLIESVWKGANSPFSQKAPTKENVLKALEGSGLHFAHEEHKHDDGGGHDGGHDAGDGGGHGGGGGGGGGGHGGH